MTQDELASRAGITRKTLARLEKGDVFSRDSTAEAVVAVLEKAGVNFFFKDDIHGVSARRS